MGRTAAAVVLAAAIGAFACPATAEEGPFTEDDLDEAFAAMMADPSNLDLTFRYGQIATSVGNYEAAIAAFERMLIFNPELPRVYLELGALYFRLESYEAASDYFEQALAFDDVPPEVEQRVHAFLDRIEERAAIHRVTYRLDVGARYQSNANAAPGDTVLAGGIPARLDDEFQPRPDWNAFVAGSVEHVYDLGTQRGTTLESDASLYVARQNELKTLDLTYLRGRTGPRVPVFDGRASIRPFADVSLVWLGDEYYLGNFGGGVQVDTMLSSQVRLQTTASGARRTFVNSDDRPNAAQQSGEQARLRARLSYAPSRTVLLTAFGGAERTFAAEDFNSYWQANVGSRAFWNFVPPLESDEGRPLTEPWTVSASVERLVRGYDDPNPIVDPTRKRRDREWRVGGQLAIPVLDGVNVFAAPQSNWVSSSLPNFEYTNHSVTLGLSGRF